MKYFYLFSIVSLLFSNCVLSQGENDNWYFGNNAGVDFSNGSPVSITGGQTYTYEGVASVSDTSGQLLFYSDGRRVWNRNHQIMPNGSNLTADGNDAHQGVVIIPFPDHPDEYFIFTTNGGVSSSFNFMAYSKIDMNEDGGLGDIVELNIPLEDPNGSIVWSGKIEAITSTNNSDSNFWIVMPYQNMLLYIFG